MAAVDMSAKAVTVRLRSASQLRRLCVLLGRAGTTLRGRDDRSADSHGPGLHPPPPRPTLQA